MPLVTQTFSSERWQVSQRMLYRDGNIVWHLGEEKAFSAVGHVNIESATEDELLCSVLCVVVLWICVSLP
jgi:hypothetical protein